jgi:hypothetical protein
VRVSLHLLFEVPDPRKMASLPVAWMASTMADGAAVKVSWVSITHTPSDELKEWRHHQTNERTCPFH